MCLLISIIDSLEGSAASRIDKPGFDHYFAWWIVIWVCEREQQVWGAATRSLPKILLWYQSVFPKNCALE